MHALKGSQVREIETRPLGWRPWLIVSVFLIFYVFSFVDRLIITMMVEPLERDLGLNDFQIGSLIGPAFGLFYVVCGIPMGWLVDRYSRRRLTIGGVGVWGAATLSGGLAANYLHLFIGRLGVGVGEATLTPAAHAMISDIFPKRRLATALAVFSVGSAVGGGVAMAAGGAIVHFLSKVQVLDLPVLGQVRSWQAVFLLVGAATLAITPLGLLLRADGLATAGRADDGQSRSDRPDVGLWRLLRRDAMLFIGLPVGFGFTTLLVNAYQAWIPTFMMRTYGWSAAQVGLAWGVQHVLTGVLGVVGGAAVVDWLYSRGVTDAHVRYQALGLFVSIPAMLWALHCGSPWLFVGLSGFFYLLTYPFFGYASAALQLFTPPHLRGQVAAVSLAILSLIGVSLGATSTAWLTDYVFADKAQLGWSLTVVTVVCAPVIFTLLHLVGRKMRKLHMQLGVERHG